MAEISLRKYIEEYLYIRDKSGHMVKLKMNDAQKDLFDTIMKQMQEHKPVRIIILKARQLGFSTLVEAIIFALTTLQSHRNSGIMTHSTDTTSALLTMFKRFYSNLPENLQPELKATNANEVIYGNKSGGGLESSIKCMTATPEGVGRGFTFDYLHLSEMTSWKGDVKDIYSTLMQCVPSIEGTMVINESTAQGFDTFKELWDDAVAGNNDYIPKFYPWIEEPTYRKKYYGFTLTEEEERLKKEYLLDNDQITWRRWCIANNCAGDVNKFRQEYPITPEEAFISSGKCIFDVEKLTTRLKEIPKVKKVGKSEYDLQYDERVLRGDIKYDYVFNRDLGLNGEMTVKNPSFTLNKNNGKLLIYEMPRKNCPYVIGCDTAGEGSDYAVAQVLDNTNGKQVAVLATEEDTDLFMRQVMALGLFYNTALIGVETNYDPSSTKMLSRMGYENQYTRETEDKKMNSYQEKFGFRTTPITRPIIITRCVEQVRDNPEMINDYITLVEMQTFVKDDNGKPQAIKGKHDDRVMSYCIALHLYSSDQQSHFIEEDKKAKRVLNWIEQSFIDARKKEGQGKWW